MYPILGARRCRRTHRRAVCLAHRTFLLMLGYFDQCLHLFNYRKDKEILLWFHFMLTDLVTRRNTSEMPIAQSTSLYERFLWKRSFATQFGVRIMFDNYLVVVSISVN